MTSLLGIPSIDARCSICERRFPESEFPCGHCVCTKCFGTAQRNNNEGDNNKEETETDDQVSDPPSCPACNQRIQHSTNAAYTVHLHGDGGPADWGAGALNSHGSHLIVNERQQQSSDDSFATANTMSDPTQHIYPNLAVETLDSLEYNRNMSRSHTTCNCQAKYIGARSSGRFATEIPPEDRPPPYNPELYFNGNGPVDQQSSNNGSHANSRTNSPRRAPPTHRYSASVLADINHDIQPCCTAACESSLAFSNPTYACGRTGAGTAEPPPKPPRQVDRPLPHAPERTPPPQPPGSQDLYNGSLCSGHTYDCASYHSYENPTPLRRTASIRPPVPPRRHSSTSVAASMLKIRQHLEQQQHQNKKRSESAPSAPSAPSSDKLNDSDPTYQSPSSLYGVSPPVPPPRRIYDSPHASPVRCVKKFGKYSEVRMQTSTFRQPTKVAQSEKGDIVVVDEQQMTVQVFTYAGDYLSLFKVIGVQGASFFSADKLAVATHRGISIFTMAGELIKELSTGLSVNTYPYKFGFVVCTPKSVQIYRQSLTLVKEISKRKTIKSYNPLNKFGKKQPDPGLFENLRDITVLSSKQIAVLDSAKGTINIIDEDGNSKMTINPALEACGPLVDAESLAADRSNNLYVADKGNQRVLRFTNHGTFSKTLINCKANPHDKRLAPYGVVITDIGNLVVSLAGDNAAEVRIYTLQ